MSRICWFAFLLVVLFAQRVFGTHLRGGEITAVALNCSEYEIIVTLYTNLGTATRAGGGVLLFGDGSMKVLPDLDNEIIDVQLKVGRARFRVTHQFTAGAFLLSYEEPSRDGGIVNIQLSSSVPFYTETLITVANSGACNHPMSFLSVPIDRGCKGSAFFHNPGAIDVDGDSLTYEIVTPKRSAGTTVNGYNAPNAPGFYAGINYQQANELQNGPPILKIDRQKGDLVWDAPGQPGEYVIAIKVNEWKKVDNQWRLSGYVIRDMQIIVEDCMNTRPRLQIPDDICVEAGTTLSKIIRGFDNESQPVKIEFFLTDDFNPVIPIITNAGVFQSTTPAAAQVEFSWNVACEHVRDQPYRVTFKITDRPETGIPLASYQTWTISVVGGAPVIQNETLDLAKRNLKLEWDVYPCAGATKMEVWRKIGTDHLTEDVCVRGISRGSGYEKVAVVVNDHSYTDSDINPGASYCYRLVAIFESRGLSKSRSSLPFCFGPVKIEAPAMTNVSVKSTSRDKGEIFIGWTSPFEIDRAQFPPPFEYDVYRSVDAVDFLKANEQRLTDTTFVDKFLNTQEAPFSYCVVVYSPNGLTRTNPLDTSGVAWSPWLTSKPVKDAVQLQWKTHTPWSNMTEKFAFHYVFRKTSDEPSFTLIDSVDTRLLEGDELFSYKDIGKQANFSWTANTLYQYRISTTGSYNNPKIREPLVNFSNEATGQPLDNQPPCPPVLTVSHLSCGDLAISACILNEYKNTVEWQEPACARDVVLYKIFFAARPDDDPVLIASESTAFITHIKSDHSFAGCYQVTAVDWQGNESARSEEICTDNCPAIFVPNVFTANADGYSDSFPAVNVNVNDPVRCSRFLERLSVKIFNRWGEEVYVSQQGTDAQFDWIGFDKQGKELPAGTYFYTLDAQFNVLDPAQRNQRLKGWVNLLR